jgi:hypothetical protein
MTRLNTAMQLIQPEAAEAHITSLEHERVQEYEQYFDTLVLDPTNYTEVFRRWMFAYASVHTSWKANCALYERLRDLQWIGNPDDLKQRIIDSRAGLHNHRTRFITDFTDYYWQHPAWFGRQPDEDWFDYRNRIMEKTLGIGRAKAAFAIELMYFQQSGVACFDTHMVQLYGFDAKTYGQGKVSNKAMDAMEQHWSETCLAHGVSPMTSRWVWWDRKQQQTDSRYWSYVLE